jgi:hypothetical protein
MNAIQYRAGHIGHREMAPQLHYVKSLEDLGTGDGATNRFDGFDFFGCSVLCKQAFPKGLCVCGIQGFGQAGNPPKVMIPCSLELTL